MLSISPSILFNCNTKEEYPSLLKKEYRSAKYSHFLPYRLFIPTNYDKKQNYPLVLILHGGGERGHDNIRQVTNVVKIFIEKDFQALYPSFILIPQCPKKEQWLNTTFKRPPFNNYSQEKIPESNSMKMIIEIINYLRSEFNIDESRLYVTGYSMGGSGTWDIISRYPNLFAAAVPVTGVSDPTKAKLITEVPIWAFHGDEDAITPIQVTKKMIEALRQNGNECKFTEYKKTGHNSWSKAYHEPELMKWLFSQRK